MEHFNTLALLIEKHRLVYNEKKRLVRQMNKLERHSGWSSKVSNYKVYSHDLKFSDPKWLYSDEIKLTVTIRGRSVQVEKPDINHNRVDVDSVLDRKEVAEYRKWCRLASKYRRLYREAKKLLDGMRAVGDVHGTKVQTSTDDGNSFNRPFYINIEGNRLTVKEFLKDQMFEEIILKEK